MEVEKTLQIFLIINSINNLYENTCKSFNYYGHGFDF